MGGVQIVSTVIAVAVTAVAVALVVRAVRQIARRDQAGPARPHPRQRPGHPARHHVPETFGHTRMFKWSVVGAAHWFVMVGFGALC